MTEHRPFSVVEKTLPGQCIRFSQWKPNMVKNEDRTGALEKTKADDRIGYKLVSSCKDSYIAMNLHYNICNEGASTCLKKNSLQSEVCTKGVVSAGYNYNK